MITTRNTQSLEIGASREPVLVVSGIVKRFGSETAVDMRGCDDLTVYAGEIALITGQSGQGKSTLLRMIQGIERPDEGSLSLFGTDITTLTPKQLAKFRRNIGIGFQSSNLYESLPVYSNIRNLANLNGHHISNTRVAELAAGLGLLHKLEDLAENCSGGEKARISMSRALANNADLVTLDEPTGGLDSPSKSKAMEALMNTMLPSAAALIVTHDEVLREYANVEFVIDNHRLVDRIDHSH